MSTDIDLTKEKRVGKYEDPVNKAAYMKRWRAANPDKVKACSERQEQRRRGNPEYRAYISELRKKVADRPHVRERVRRSAAAYRKRHPEKQAAHRAVYAALRSGVLVKPDSCSKCGSNKKLHAHHENYSLPLAVTWLCIPCHTEVHNELP